MDEKDPKNTEGEKKWFGDTVRDIAAAGLATFFMTEEGVRGYLKEKKLPTELVSALLEGLSKKKEDLYGVVAKELGTVISKIDVTKEIGKFLQHHKIHVNASITFEKKSGQEEPNEKG